MKRLLPLLCACNQAFTLEPTKLVDAAQPRVFACPDPGPATYSPRLHEIPTDHGLCVDYTISAATNRAVAFCYADGIFGISEGPIDGPLAFVLTDPDKFTHYIAPRLSPDGQRLYILVSTSQFRRVSRFVRTPSGWVDDMKMLPFTTGTLSTIATAPTGDRVIYLEPDGDLQEYVDDAPVGAPINAATLEVPSIEDPSLSTDGLRLAVHVRENGESHMFFAERPNVDVPFGRATRFPGVPAGSGTSFMTDDCARVYVAGLDRVFYVEQE
jgi:hypothetical protein